ncbi:hypothetical protein E2562_014630 [Oryza meyeriana var. granulata]|uniref:F-box domain-containing protein n=1 Tax=Oryza meyeriana var. granulata TaxID=110450 RepID=A0A6G1D3N7_9ORYZ|nr:hypothetical protein E2562_014630 [Oryza meyeriana var. granulata]
MREKEAALGEERHFCSGSRVPEAFAAALLVVVVAYDSPVSARAAVRSPCRPPPVLQNSSHGAVVAAEPRRLHPGDLHTDALFEVLVRLPSKDIRRLHAVAARGEP